jgi:hypothetical protein
VIAGDDQLVRGIEVKKVGTHEAPGHDIAAGHILILASSQARLFGDSCATVTRTLCKRATSVGCRSYFDCKNISIGDTVQ